VIRECEQKHIDRILLVQVLGKERFTAALESRQTEL
jgi:hypothetical protein